MGYGRGDHLDREHRRYRRGHGSVLRDDAVALQHVGYSLMESRGSGSETTGYIRGDARALLALSRTRGELVPYSMMVTVFHLR